MRENLARPISGLLLAVLLLLPNALPAGAAKLKVLTDPKKTCSAIQLSGEIFAGDYDRFSAILRKAAAIAPVRRLYLNSEGGQLLAAFAMTDLIRQMAPNIETVVQPRQMCNSACVTLLTVGSQRYVSRRAAVIVHRAFDTKTNKTNVEATKQQGEFMIDNGMSLGVGETMGKLRPKQQIQVTQSNAKKLGFDSFKFYRGANPPATAGCSWTGPATAKP